MVRQGGGGLRRGLRPLADRPISDFIPVLGYLDEVVILPIGIVLAVRLVPPDLMAEFRTRRRARAGMAPSPPIIS